MEKSAILHADLLDIVFEGRNKTYGAYDLRRTYNRRLKISLSVMLFIMLLLFTAQWLSGKTNDKAVIALGPDVHLEPPPPQEEPIYEPPPPTPPPPAAEPPKIEMAKVTPPVIVPDDQVKPEDMPPANDDLEDVRIGNMNVDGIKDDGTVIAPPKETAGTGIIDKPVYRNPDSLHLFVQIESSFPGGTAAWHRFIKRNLRIPQDAIDNGIGGTVTVQFIVDREGKVSDVKALDGPEELREEAVRVIRKSGQWNPAIQNGAKVKSYKRQPIVILVQNE